jgi:hypothetical protein
MSPTELSLREARKRWGYAETVERWNQFARIRQDFAGIIDIIALGDGETIGIQATSYPNIASRVNKIADHANTGYLRKANWTLLVWGWKKVGNRWEVSERDVS